MDLLPTDDQNQILSSVTSYLSKELPIDRHRGKKGTCTEPGKDALKALAEMGWYSLSLPEASGGVGYTLIEEMLLFREIGRQLGPIPVLAGVLGAHVAALAKSEDLTAKIVSGEARVALAAGHTADAKKDSFAGSVQIFGAKDCDFVLLIGQKKAALFSAAKLADWQSRDCLDSTISMAVAKLDGAKPAAMVSDNSQALFRRAIILTAAMQVGVAEAASEMASEYAKIRVQFGKPIGSFQAVRHPCADNATRCEAAHSQLIFAAICEQNNRDDAAFQVSAAAILAGDAAIRNCRTNIQTHGAMGVTDELSAHLLLKRAHVLEQLFRTPNNHLADMLSAPAPTE